MSYNIAQGVYQTQHGHRKGTAIIRCPYISHRIEVYESCSLNILDGAEVYWSEIRQFKRKRETVIQAAVVGLKDCRYIYGGKEIICSMKIQAGCQSQLQAQVRFEGHPIDKKIPSLHIVNGESLVDWYRSEYAKTEEISGQNQSYNSLQKKYFWVRIVAWNYQETQPRAIVTRVFSSHDAKTVEAETEVILHSLGISEKTDPENLRLAHLKKKQKKHFPISGHKQFNKMVFTIDPQQSQDMQDAISIQLLENSSQQKKNSPQKDEQQADFNNSAKSNKSTNSSISNSQPNKIYEVGVHISDVTAYLPLVEEMRDQIAQRGSTIYLPQKVINMFPDQIVQMCTLFPNQRKLAISVLFKIDENGNLLDEPKFKKNIIKSVAKLSYDQAEEIIRNNCNESFVQKFIAKHKISIGQYQLLAEKIRILKTLSAKRKNLRLKFRSHSIPYKNEVTFKLDSDNFPVQIGIKKSLDSERLIEQFMILTNESVARKLVQDYGENSLLIHHPKPSDYSISYLNEIFSDFGIRFTNKKVENLEDEIGKILGTEGVKDEIKQLLQVRAMHIQEHASYTRYMHSAKGHYGLNLQYYTHFTSPMRRFADVIAHEQLLECLKGKRIHTEPNSSSYKKIGMKTERLLREIEYANKARFRNKKLKQMVAECFINMLLHKESKSLKVKGLILSLGLKSATVYIPGYHIIKEVQWKTKVQYENDGIKVRTSGQEEKWVEFQRNDSVDVQIESQMHQEVKATILIDGLPL